MRSDDRSDLYFFFFNDTATTEIYPLSLHDALPISGLRRRDSGGGRLRSRPPPGRHRRAHRHRADGRPPAIGDRKSTRLNSSHGYISYAVFCLKKKRYYRGERCTVLQIDDL